MAASVGLTPLEAARIRCVADPDRYREGGLAGTLSSIASEGGGGGAARAAGTDLSTKVTAVEGFRALYGGFPTLVTRQVIFGSVKFLTFERAASAIYGIWPILGESTATSLGVSLVAGGIAGTLSSVVSQPADSVLTYIARQEGGGDDNDGDGNRESMGLLEGTRSLIDEDGPSALFRGLGSRCVWAGSIIAGQFLLYDVFRTVFGVNTDDLTEIFEVVIDAAKG